MAEQILYGAVEPYAFGALFVFLLLYVLKTTRAREKESQEREDRLMDNLDKLSESYRSSTEVMEKMQELQKEMKSGIDDKLDQIYDTIKDQGRGD